MSFKRLLLAICMIACVSVSSRGAVRDYVVEARTNGGNDSLKVQWYRLGFTYVGENKYTTFPFVDTVPIDMAYFYKFRSIWFDGPDTAWSEWYSLQVDTLTLVSYNTTISLLTGGGYDSVKVFVKENGLTPMASIATSSFPYNANLFGLSPSKFYTTEYLWFDGADTVQNDGFIPTLAVTTGTGSGGNCTPAPGPYVTAYIDIGAGYIDSTSGLMVSRERVELWCELIGSNRLNDGYFTVVPSIYKKKTDSAGRARFYLPPNNYLTPAGSYYQLSYTAKSGQIWSSGIIKRFTLDSLPDPINIINAQEVR